LAIAETIEAAHKAIKRHVLYSKKVNPSRLNNLTKSDSPLSIRTDIGGAVLFYLRVVKVLSKSMEGNWVISKVIEGGSVIWRYYYKLHSKGVKLFQLRRFLTLYNRFLFLVAT
jgi:hypothetical protein